MNEKLSLFRTTEGEREYHAAYGAVLAKWPIPYESIFVPTRYGDTHIIVSGTKANPP